MEDSNSRKCRRRREERGRVRWEVGGAYRNRGIEDREIKRTKISDCGKKKEKGKGIGEYGVNGSGLCDVAGLKPLHCPPLQR